MIEAGSGSKSTGSWFTSRRGGAIFTHADLARGILDTRADFERVIARLEALEALVIQTGGEE